MKALVLLYLRWRTGGDVAALKPPLGIAPKCWSGRSATLGERARYTLRLARYQFESWLHDHWGEEMREGWCQRNLKG